MGILSDILDKYSEKKKEEKKLTIKGVDFEMPRSEITRPAAIQSPVTRLWERETEPSQLEISTKAEEYAQKPIWEKLLTQINPFADQTALDYAYDPKSDKYQRVIAGVADFGVPAGAGAQGIKGLSQIAKTQGAKGVISQLGKNLIEPPQMGKENILKTIGKEILAIEEKPKSVPKFSPELQPIVDKLTSFIKGAPKLSRGEAELMKHAERQQRVAAGAKILESTPIKEGAFEKALAAQAGEIPTPKFKPPKMELPPDEISSLRESIQKSNLTFFYKENTDLALRKVFMGEIPTSGELNLLEKFFGPDLVKSIRSKIGLGTKAWKNFVDSLGLPRALMASMDESAVLRQSVILTAGHPVKAAKNAWAMLKASSYSKWAFEIDDAMRADPLFEIFEKSGGYMAPLRQGVGRLSQYEEQFMSKIATHIPGIRQSERGYVTYLNKMRFDIFKSMFQKAQKMGIKAEDLNLTDWARFVNLASGRGNLGNMSDRVSDLAAAANAIFFSPRLAMSRIQLPKLYLELVKKSFTSIPKDARTPETINKLIQQRQVARIALKEATRSIAAFVAFGTTVLGAGALALKGELENDPRSADFAKLKVGNTRIDPWGGFQQYARFAAQFATSERKTTTTGGIQPINRSDVVFNFLRSKTSPIFSMFLDLLKGQDYRGRPMEATEEGLKQQAFERLVPLFAQDMYDAFQDEGLTGLALASPGFLGVGVQTYPDTLIDKEAQLGQMANIGSLKTPKYDTYTLSKFGSDISRYGGDGKNGSPLTQFYFTSQKDFDKYNKISTGERISYREKNPRVDAMLFFWGKVDVVRSEDAKKFVLQYLDEYGLDESSLHRELKTSKSQATVIDKIKQQLNTGKPSDLMNKIRKQLNLK
jgi:hypothetical protein